MPKGSRPTIDDPDFLVSVTTPIHGQQPYLALQLAALGSQDYAGAFEIVLVDNGMAAETLTLCTEFVAQDPRARIHGARDVRGIAAVMNAAFRATSGQLVCKCDSDDIVDPGWLRNLVVAAASADIVGGHLEVAALNSTHATAARPPYTGDGLPVEQSGLSWAVAANIAYWRDVHDRLGGFCEYVDTEDIEFCVRAQRDFGWQVAYAPDAIVHYRYRESVRPMMAQARSYGKKTSRMVTAQDRDLSVRDALWYAAKGMLDKPTRDPAVVQFRRWASRAAFRFGYVESRLQPQRSIACSCSRCATQGTVATN